MAQSFYLLKTVVGEADLVEAGEKDACEDYWSNYEDAAEDSESKDYSLDASVVLFKSSLQLHGLVEGHADACAVQGVDTLCHSDGELGDSPELSVANHDLARRRQVKP